MGHSLLFWRGVASPLLCCPLQNCWCFGAQLTEEHLVPGNSAEFRHELELQSPGAGSVFLSNIHVHN